MKVLLAAAVISFVLGLLDEHESLVGALLEPSVIFAILIANAMVGVWQESNAEEALEACGALSKSSRFWIEEARLLLGPTIAAANQHQSMQQALKKYEAKKANVRRDGQLSVISATELVPGDIVEMSGGSRTRPAPSSLEHLMHVSPTALGVTSPRCSGRKCPCRHSPSQADLVLLQGRPNDSYRRVFHSFQSTTRSPCTGHVAGTLPP